MEVGGNPILTTHDLTMRFGGVVAVNKVNFSLSEGELRCLIGPNGAGKSTFFKCLTGQLDPTEGSIQFYGSELAGEQTHAIVRKGIGIKTQVPNLFDGLAARENVALSACRQHTERHANTVVDQVMEQMGITELAPFIVGNLAHGQRQLVELAMVLAGEPKLVLLDEPAAGMAGEERRRLAEVVRRMAGSTTFIVVEHDMEFIKDIATDVTVFHRGAIFLEGHVDDIMAHPEVQEIYLGKGNDVAA